MPDPLPPLPRDLARRAVARALAIDAAAEDARSSRYRRRPAAGRRQTQTPMQGQAATRDADTGAHRRAFVLHALGAFGLAGTGLAGAGLVGAPGHAGATVAPAAIGDLVRWPDLRLIDGQAWTGTQAAGQVVVVVFFSTTCPYCLRHNRRVTTLAAATAGRGLRVLGVAQDGDAGAVSQHMARHGHRFDVTLDRRAMHQVLSPRRLVPLTCVVDRQSRLREVIPGEMSEDDVSGLARWIDR